MWRKFTKTCQEISGLLNLTISVRLNQQPPAPPGSQPTDQHQEASMTIQFPDTEQISSTPIHDAKILTGTNGLAHIQLNDQLYTLRITRAGKLILTK